MTVPDQPNRAWRRRPTRGPADARPGEAATGAWTAWRLLGRNNRELGRSPQTFRTVPDCVSSIVDLKATAKEAARLLSVDVEDGRWLWRLEVGGTPVAVSARSYQRQRECLYSLEQFLAAVTEAEPPAILVELPSERRDRLPPAQPYRAGASRTDQDDDDGPGEAPGPIAVRVGDELAS